MTRGKPTRQQIRARARRGQTSRRVGPAVFLVGGAIVAAAIVAIVLTAGGEDGAPPAATGPVTVTVSGDSLPAFAEGDDPAVGLPAPTLQGEDFRGQPVAVADDGRPKAIVFLAHWCPHCQREVPVIQDWLDAEGAPQDVDLYSVATSIDPAQPNYPPDAWLEREGWTVPVLVDDADGNVVARASGELTIEQLTGYLSQTTA